MAQHFLDHLEGNSLDRVELIMTVEEILGGYIPPEDERKIRSFRTVQQAIDYLEKRRGNGGLN